MLLSVLRVKLHKATVTSKSMDYEGSITIGEELLEKSGLKEFEEVQVWNITNGARFSTYVIKGNGKEICLNGAAARLVEVGDRVIIAAFGLIDETEYDKVKPKILVLDEKNNIVKIFND